MSGNTIRASLDELLMACDLIKAEQYGCDVCPLNRGSECLDYNSVEDLWNKVSIRRLDDFLEVADHIDSYVEEYKEQLEEEEARQQEEYNDWITELTKGFFRDRGLK